MRKKLLGLSIILLGLFFSSAALAKDTVWIDEYGLSFNLPSHFAWITREDGDFTVIESIVGEERDELLLQMEESSVYAWCLDPNSDMSVYCTVNLAEYTQKNYSYFDEEELLIQGDAAFKEQHGGDGERKIYTTLFTKFEWMYFPNYMRGDSYIGIQTCIDGLFYGFAIRGSDDA